MKIETMRGALGDAARCLAGARLIVGKAYPNGTAPADLLPALTIVIALSMASSRKRGAVMLIDPSIPELGDAIRHVARALTEGRKAYEPDARIAQLLLCLADGMTGENRLQDGRHKHRVTICACCGHIAQPCPGAWVVWTSSHGVAYDIGAPLCECCSNRVKEDPEKLMQEVVERIGHLPQPRFEIWAA